ncbi:hypothetical protein CYMTET_29209 [Cymbomonas tetramitiformis]|uniref:Uncharacterized protein n=1 Tax=Cymbomonas tetramitiformis TaxID=36881 RepID=A0AAE0FLK5_9CHLO|nr:hypothetical protein CYMTET_29209 [Cymbomonas tetramitiformis]
MSCPSHSPLPVAESVLAAHGSLRVRNAALRTRSTVKGGSRGALLPRCTGNKLAVHPSQGSGRSQRSVRAAAGLSHGQAQILAVRLLPLRCP